MIFGVVYYIVDYVFFYHVSRSRVVIFNGEYASELGYAMYLLWHELSSGITNFSLLWLCISKDKDLKLWLILVIGWCLYALQYPNLVEVEILLHIGQLLLTMVLWL